VTVAVDLIDVLVTVAAGLVEVTVKEEAGAVRVTVLLLPDIVWCIVEVTGLVVVTVRVLYATIVASTVRVRVAVTVTIFWILLYPL
jgi:hypothetical protein